MGDYHTSEIDFVFGNEFPFGVHRFDDACDAEMRDLMGAYWTAFAATGSPNGGGDGEDGRADEETASFVEQRRRARLAAALQWPAYGSVTEKRLELDVPLAVTAHLNQQRCDALDGVLGF